MGAGFFTDRMPFLLSDQQWQNAMHEKPTTKPHLLLIHRWIEYGQPTTLSTSALQCQYWPAIQWVHINILAAPNCNDARVNGSYIDIV